MFKQKLILRLKIFFFVTLCYITLFWIVDFIRNPCMLPLPIYQHPITLLQPQLKYGKSDILLLDKNGEYKTTKFRAQCAHLRISGKSSSSFCDQYRYALEDVKLLRVEGAFLYNNWYRSDRLIISSMTYIDPYDGKTKIFKLSEQEIKEWEHFFTNSQLFDFILLIVSIISWFSYFLLYFLKRKNNK